MRKFTVLFLSILVFGAFASAQLEPKTFAVPKTELFVEYAFQHAGTSGSDLATTAGGFNVDSTNLNGFAFGFSHYLHSNFGYMVDISRGSNGAVDSTGTKYVRWTYLAGPSYRLHNLLFFAPSVHVLAGFDRDEFTVPHDFTVIDRKDTDFAAAAGVTFDGNLSRHMALRLAQVDYLYTRNYGTSQSSFRYTGGLVVRF